MADSGSWIRLVRPSGRFTTLFAIACFASACAANVVIGQEQPVNAVLRRYCLGCHGNVEPAGDFSLIASADSAESEDRQDRTAAILRVLTSRNDDRMPPTGESQPSDDERQVLVDWVRSGARTSAEMFLPEVPTIPVVQSGSRPAVYSAALVQQAGLLLGSDGAVRSEDADGVMLRVSGNVNDLAVDDAGRIYAAGGVPGAVGEVVEWSPASKTPPRRFTDHSDAVYAVAVTADGRRLATAGYDRVIRTYERSEEGEWRAAHSLTGHNGAVFDLAFSPSGDVLASASADATVKIWNSKTGERLDTLSQPLSEQYALAFSADGETLYAGGADNRIREWRIVSRARPQINRLLRARFAHEAPIIALKVDAAGKQLASLSEDGNLRVWGLEPFRQKMSQRIRDLNVSTFVWLQAGQIRVFGFDGRWKEVGVQEEVLPPPGNSTADSTPVFDVRDAKEISSGSQIAGELKHRPQMVYRFEASAGERLVIEALAAKGSQIDPIIRVTDDTGRPVLRAQLQAIRDSWFTFRGKDSSTSDDFRLFNWREMELNEYLYSDGEIVRLWMYPRGPDSGFRVYPGYGQRHTWFGTSPTAHALQAPAYIVRVLPPEQIPESSGLPIFPLYYENDDDGRRRMGNNSQLYFTAPGTGRYCIIVSDARGIVPSASDYELRVRAPKPDFSVTLNSTSPKVSPGTGAELMFTADRRDEFSGPIEVRIGGLPEGYTVTSPVVIQPNQWRASAVLNALPGAAPVTEDQLAAVTIEAAAEIHGKEVVNAVGGLKQVNWAEARPVRLRLSGGEDTGGHRNFDEIPALTELTIHPGETVRLRIHAERNKFAGRIDFGKDESGRNLPHGVFVDNIGLNGLMLTEGKTEREFFITAAPWVPSTDRPFFLKAANVDGGVASFPVMLHVRPRSKTGPATGAD